MLDPASCCSGRRTCRRRRSQEDREKDGSICVLHGYAGNGNHVPLFLVDRERVSSDDPNATQEMYDEIYPTFIEDKVIMKLNRNG